VARDTWFLTDIKYRPIYLAIQTMFFKQNKFVGIIMKGKKRGAMVLNIIIMFKLLRKTVGLRNLNT
jgi:hypothetical protein